VVILSVLGGLGLFGSDMEGYEGDGRKGDKGFSGKLNARGGLSVVGSLKGLCGL
jgi:hypothetical protein